MESYTFDKTGLDALLHRLTSQGYRIIGPRLGEHAIIYGDVRSVADLPAGWGDVQERGHYALRSFADKPLFRYAVGPHSWKGILHPAVQCVMGRATDEAEDKEPTKIAFLGVRPCELAAIERLDRVLRSGDPAYQQRRRGVFLIGVNCTEPAATCFCPSMNTGPHHTAPCHTGRIGSTTLDTNTLGTYSLDLILTEVCSADTHFFLCRSASERGESFLHPLGFPRATPHELRAADEELAATHNKFTRSLAVEGPGGRVATLLQSTLESPLWEKLSETCLSCGNCTSVCPTCYCTHQSVETSLEWNPRQDDAVQIENTGHFEASGNFQTTVQLKKEWESCFSERFSFIHSGAVRRSTKARYRQWVTHKLSTWHDHFGSSGCVGCGRCITWCPVGIDITEVVSRFRDEAAVRGEQ